MTNLRFRADIVAGKRVGINANLPNFTGAEVEIVQVNANKDFANVLYKPVGDVPCSKWSGADDLMGRGMITEKDNDGLLIPRADMVTAACKNGEVTFSPKPKGN
jgi:hypothetical protein